MNERRFLSLEEAANYYGYNSGNALRMAFRRGTLPIRFLHRMGKRKLVVDHVAMDQEMFSKTIRQGELFQ